MTRDTKAESEAAVFYGAAAVAAFELRVNRKADEKERRRLRERAAVAVWTGQDPMAYAAAA